MSRALMIAVAAGVGAYLAGPTIIARGLAVAGYGSQDGGVAQSADTVYANAAIVADRWRIPAAAAAAGLAYWIAK